MSFIDHLANSPEKNQARWERDPQNPVIPAGASWCKEFIAPSSLLVDGDRLVLYTEGGSDDRECIGRYSAPTDAAFQAGWIPDPGNPLLEPSDEGFDRGSVFDPAVVRFQEQVHLYYSATTGGAHAFAEQSNVASDQTPDDETIGHAIAIGQGLQRTPGPVMEGRCPYAIEYRGDIYVFHVAVAAGGYRIHAARSSDGSTFAPIASGPVLDVGRPGAWDSYSVTTPKIFTEDNRFIMLYAGDDRGLDDPTGIGVAVSEDLIHWDRHPGNPIFRPGGPGTFDSYSVASAVPFRAHGAWHVLYAGAAHPVSEGLKSQIGAARLPFS